MLRRRSSGHRAGGGGGGGSGYSFSKTITVDHTKCGTANTTDYPLLFSATIAALKTVANGGSVQSGSGYDIAFFSDSGLTTMLDFEVESWDAATGAIVAWVRVPTLTFASDAVIYLGYGNASIVASQQNVTGTWNSDYKGVWHLDATTNDSTATGATLNRTSGSPTFVAAQVGNGLSINGTIGDAVGPTNSAPFASTGAFTVEAWAKPTNFSANRTVIAKGNGSNQNYFLTVLNTSGHAYVQFTQSGVVKAVQGTSTLSTSACSYLAATYDGATLTLYVNGASEGTPLSVTGATDNPGGLVVGAVDINEPFLGVIDEPRMSSIARSASYVTAQYNNVSSPSTFYAVT